MGENKHTEKRETQSRETCGPRGVRTAGIEREALTGDTTSAVAPTTTNRALFEN